MNNPYRESPPEDYNAALAREVTDQARKAKREQLKARVTPETRRFILAAVRDAARQSQESVSFCDGPQTPKRLWPAIMVWLKELSFTYRVAGEEQELTVGW